MSVTFEVETLKIFEPDKECQEMVQEVYREHAKFLAFLERKTTEKVENCDLARQAKILELRELEKVDEDIAAEQGALFVESGDVDNAVQSSYKAMREFKRDAEPNPTFALPADIAAFDARVKELEAAHDAASETQREYNTRVGWWKSRQSRHEEAKQKLSDEINRLWRISQRLQGKKIEPAYNELGLPVMDIPVPVQPVGLPGFGLPSKQLR